MEKIPLKSAIYLPLFVWTFLTVHQKAQQWCLVSQTHPLHIHVGLGHVNSRDRTDTPKDTPRKRYHMHICTHICTL